MANVRIFKAKKLSDLLGEVQFRSVIREGVDKRTGEIYTIVKVELPDSDEFLEVQVYGLAKDEFPKNIKKLDVIDFEDVEYIARANARAMGSFAMGELGEQIKVQKIAGMKPLHQTNV